MSYQTKPAKIDATAKLQRYARPGERILEFTTENGKSGRIAIEQDSYGIVRLRLVRLDKGIQVEFSA